MYPTSAWCAACPAVMNPAASTCAYCGGPLRPKPSAEREGHGDADSSPAAPTSNAAGRRPTPHDRDRASGAVGDQPRD